MVDLRRHPLRYSCGICGYRTRPHYGKDAALECRLEFDLFHRCGQKPDDAVGKPFLVLAGGIRRCLVCDGFFTRSACERPGY